MLACIGLACVTERVVEPPPADPLGGRAILAGLVEGRGPEGAVGERPAVEAPPQLGWSLLRERYDLNGDNRVTEDELGGRDLLRHDHDRSGTVTIEDFPVESSDVSARAEAVLVRSLAQRALLRALADPAAPGAPLAETWHARFAELDRDRDQRLSRAEFEAGAPRPPTGRDPFGAVLALLDRDDDDHLGWLELELR
ncbi:MAG: hypothetical protein P1V81_03080 [Planctomycetota bacterium]|nr:hypothetical protein [Planctomycetota bacterium]